MSLFAAFFTHEHRKPITALITKLIAILFK
jgi:hypothetical protein